MGMFDPIQRSAGIQQAFDNLNSQLDFSMPEPAPNLQDPKALQAAAQKAMQEGDMQKAQKLQQMASQVEAKQNAMANQNVLSAYQQVKGTPQEEKFVQAMKQSGKYDIIRSEQDKDMQREATSITLDNAKADKEASVLLGDFIRAREAGNSVEAARIRQHALDNNLSEKIDAYQDKRRERSWQEFRQDLIKQEEAQKQVQLKYSKMPVPRDLQDQQALIEEAHKEGQGDYLQQRFAAANAMRKDLAEEAQRSKWQNLTFNDEELKKVGMTRESYNSMYQADPVGTNKRLSEKLIDYKATDKATKTITQADQKMWLAQIEERTKDGEGIIWDDENFKIAEEVGELLAAKAAELYKNGMSFEAVSLYVDEVLAGKIKIGSQK